MVLTVMFHFYGQYHIPKTHYSLAYDPSPIPHNLYPISAQTKLNFEEALSHLITYSCITYLTMSVSLSAISPSMIFRPSIHQEMPL